MIDGRGGRQPAGPVEVHTPEELIDVPEAFLQATIQKVERPDKWAARASALAGALRAQAKAEPERSAIYETFSRECEEVAELLWAEYDLRKSKAAG